MILFFSIYFIVLLIYLFSKIVNLKAVDIISVFIISSLLSILQGFRALNIGTDTYMYDAILYSDISPGSYYANNIEPGYIFLVKLFQNYNIQDYFFYFVSFISNYFILSAIYRSRRNRFLMLLSYLSFSHVFLMGFNILRQQLALSIFIYSIKYIINLKYLKFILFTFLATTIHYSSLFFLIFIPIHVLLRKYMLKTAYTVVFFIPFVINYLQVFIIFLVGQKTGKETFENYIGSSQSMAGGLWMSFYILILIYFIFLKNKKELEYYFYLCAYILFVSIYINISFLGLSYEGPGRILVCTYFSLIFIFAHLKYGEYAIFHYIVFISIFVLFFIYMYLMNGLHQIFPYQSVL